MNVYKLSRNDKCLCGSNKKFKYCCMNYVGDLQNKNISTFIKKLIKVEDYKLAYLYYNAFLTNYLINIKRHTEPLIDMNKKIGFKLLEIDIKALAEIFDKIGYVINDGNLNVNLNKKLKNIESLFDNKSFFELVRYYRLFYLEIMNNDVELIKDLLDGLDYEKINDVRLLKMYYLYISDKHEYAIKNELLKKIINKENDIYSKLQFTVILSINYKVNNDIKYSLKFGDKAIKILNNLKTNNINPYELYIIANSIFLCGIIFDNKKYYEESIHKFSELLNLEKQNEENPKIIAHIYNYLGESYILLKDYMKAIEVLEKSNNYLFTHLAHIKIAKAYIEMNEYKKADDEIKNLDINSIPKENLLDYLLVMGEILIFNNDKERAYKIYKSLKKIIICEKLFDIYRDDLIIKLLEKYKGFYETNETSSLKEKILELNNIITLSPNFFGVGININKIIERFLKNDKFRN